MGHSVARRATSCPSAKDSMQRSPRPLTPLKPLTPLLAALMLAPVIACSVTASAQEVIQAALPESSVECLPQIGPQTSVVALDFSPDGKLLAQGGGGGWGSDAGEINLYDVQSGELLRTFAAPPFSASPGVAASPTRGPVTLVRFVDNGAQLATATTASHGTSADGAVRFWDVKSGRLLRALPPQGAVFAVAVSDDGQWVARSQPSSETLHAPSARQLTLENTATGTKRILAATGVVYRLSFSSHGGTLLGADAGGLKAWDVDTGAGRQLPAAQLPGGPGGPGGVAKPRNMVLAEHTPRLPQFSADGKRYADEVPGGFGVWDTETGQRHAWIELPAELRHQVVAAVFFDNGRQLALQVGKDLRFWNLAASSSAASSGAVAPVTRLSALPGATLPGETLFGPFLAIAVAPDGGMVAVGVDRWGERERRTREIIKEIRLLAIPGVASGAASRRVITGRVNPATWVGFSPDGATLYSTWRDTGVRFWDARSGQLKNSWVAALGANEAIAVSRAGTLIARGNNFGTQKEGLIVLRASGATVMKAPTESGVIDFIAMAPDDTRLAVDDAGGVRVYDLATGRSLHQFPGLTGMVFASAFSPDSKTLATIGTGGACLWSLADGELRGKLTATNFNPRQGTFSPDGQLLASLERERVMLWDVATQTPLAVWAPDGERPSAVAISPAGATGDRGATDATLAIATNTSVRQYELNNLPDMKTALRDGPRPLQATLQAWHLPRGGTHSLAFSPDGSTLAVACDDGAIRLFHVAQGRLRVELRVLPSAGDGQISQEWAAITADGSWTGSPGAAAFLRWREGSGLTAEAARFENAGRVQQALAP